MCLSLKKQSNLMSVFNATLLWHTQNLAFQEMWVLSFQMTLSVSLTHNRDNMKYVSRS